MSIIRATCHQRWPSLQVLTESGKQSCMHCFLQLEYAQLHWSHLRITSTSLWYFAIIKGKTLVMSKLTSFRAIAAACLDGVFNILYGCSIVEYEVWQDAVYAAEHQVCLCKARPVAVFIYIVRRHIDVSTLCQSARLLAAAVNLKLCPNGKRNKIIPK